MRTQMTMLLGVLLGMALVIATDGLRVIPDSLAAAGGAPVASQAIGLQAATPEAGDAEMTEKMERMIDECLTMMHNMNAMMGMMGGDMAGMMGEEGMQSMGGMQATPTP
jgi:glutamate dehydrogenase/leucine dehydrogenase